MVPAQSVRIHRLAEDPRREGTSIRSNRGERNDVEIEENWPFLAAPPIPRGRRPFQQHQRAALRQSAPTERWVADWFV